MNPKVDLSLALGLLCCQSINVAYTHTSEGEINELIAKKRRKSKVACKRKKKKGKTKKKKKKHIATAINQLKTIKQRGKKDNPIFKLSLRVQDLLST